MNAKFIVVQKCCFILLAWSVRKDNCCSHLTLNCKDSEDCECKQMRHYDVVNFFKIFAELLLQAKWSCREKKFVFLNSKQENSQILLCLQCGKTLPVCYEKHINNFLQHRNLMSSPCGFLFFRGESHRNLMSSPCGFLLFRGGSN